MNCTSTQGKLNGEALKSSLLFRHLGCDIDKYATTVRQLDRQEQRRLRVSIARGDDWEHRGERATTPGATAPPINKARLAAWLRGELGKIRDECRGLLREQVAAARVAIEDSIAEAIDERFMQLENRP